MRPTKKTASISCLRTTSLLLFLIAVTQDLTRSNLKEEDFILAFNIRAQSTMAGNVRYPVHLLPVANGRMLVHLWMKPVAMGGCLFTFGCSLLLWEDACSPLGAAGSREGEIVHVANSLLFFLNQSKTPACQCCHHI